MRSGVNPERRQARASSSCSDPFQPRSWALVVSLNHVARVVSNAIVRRSGTATLNRRATGFAAGAFFLLLAATPMNSLRRYYRTPTVYYPAPETASEIMQEPDTKPDSEARNVQGKSCLPSITEFRDVTAGRRIAGVIVSPLPVELDRVPQQAREDRKRSLEALALLRGD